MGVSVKDFNLVIMKISSPQKSADSKPKINWVIRSGADNAAEMRKDDPIEINIDFFTFLSRPGEARVS